MIALRLGKNAVEPEAVRRVIHAVRKVTSRETVRRAAAEAAEAELVELVELVQETATIVISRDTWPGIVRRNGKGERRERRGEALGAGTR